MAADAPDGERAAPRRVCVGAIAGAFGVRGEVRIKPFTAEPEAIAGYGPLETEDGARRFTLRLTRPIKGGLAGRLSAVATREQAEALRGQRLYVARDALPEDALDEDEYYHADLVGLAVVDLSGKPLGTVRAVLDFGAGDLLEVVGPGLKQAALLPFTQEAAPHVDLARGEVTADPPEGVFEWRDAPKARQDAGDEGDDGEDPGTPDRDEGEAR